MITYIIEAIYLEEVNNAIMDYGQTKFEVAKETNTDEWLVSQGIEDTQLVKNLGVFAISFFLILLAFLFYFIIKKCGGCCKLCIKIREKVYKKLFYNGPFRYITEGYLKLFNDFLTFFL